MTSPAPSTEIEVTCDVYERLETIRRRLVRQRKKYYQHKYPGLEIDPDPTDVSMCEVIYELLMLWDFEKSTT